MVWISMTYPEIISPWWSYTKAMVAASYWADSVYIGVPYTSLRMRQNKLRDFDNIEKTITDLHAKWAKAYLTMNIFPRNMDINIFESVIDRISGLDIDAIIFSDPGTFNIIRKYLPNVKLHLSTQANTLNYEAIQFRYDLWVQRVVLARELNIKEIKTIRTKVPKMELEVFVHGSMCIAYSWRCLLWEYFSWRDGNKGECSHVCRYKFNKTQDPTDALLYEGSVIEEKRKDKKFAVAQDDEGSYIFSSKDLCTIERIKEIMPYVDGLKIEWRSKGELYVWTVTKAYRHARDAVFNNTLVDTSITDLVYQIPHRPYREGFFFNDIRSAPDGEPDITKETGTTLESAGPVVQKEYYWLILPETKDIVIGDKSITCHRFIVKQQMLSWITLEYLSATWKWDITIKHFFNKAGKVVDEVKTIGDEIYIQTDIDCQWWEVFYGPVLNH